MPPEEDGRPSSPGQAGMMRLRSLLKWLPGALAVALTIAGIAACGLDSNRSGGTFLVGEVSGSELGLVLLLIAVPFAVVALGRLWSVVGRVGNNWVPFLVRLLAVALMVALLPAGAVALVVLGLASSWSYSRLDVPGRDIVATEHTWRHREIGFLERDGLYHRSLPTCGVPIDAYNAFAHGDYEVTAVAGRTIVRYATAPGGEKDVPLDLSIGRDDLAHVCGGEVVPAPTGSPHAPAAPPS
jgi:hypothetical protein